MEKRIESSPAWLSILRWTARIFAMIFVIFFLFMFIGESIGSSTHYAHLYWRDYLLLSLWFITVIALLIGLWSELYGGLISLVSTLTHFTFLTFEGNRAPIFFIILVPSILYLMSWYYHRQMLTDKWRIWNGILSWFLYSFPDSFMPRIQSVNLKDNWMHMQD